MKKKVRHGAAQVLLETRQSEMLETSPPTHMQIHHLQ